MRNGFNRLMSRSIFTESDTIVGRDGDGAELREGSETDGAATIGDKVEEGATEGDDGAVGGETVHDCFHGVFSDTVADVST